MTSRPVSTVLAALEAGPGLPPLRHLPSTGTQPDQQLLDQIKSQCPAQTVDREWQKNLPYRYGWKLFNHGYYWEAHEVWEAVWLRARPNSPERYLLQCLIQLSNARLKQCLGLGRATERLMEMAGQLAAGAFPISGNLAAERELMGVAEWWLSKMFGKTAF